MGAHQVIRVSVLKDNYAYLIHDRESGETIAIDPGEAAPVLAECQLRGWRLSHILNTHHHVDHVGANFAVKEAMGCKIIGHAKDAARIPGIDQTVEEGQTLLFGSLAIECLDIVGHTVGHIAYYLPQDSALFCGDTLFSLGCGRMFEGTPEQFWQSLLRLRALPDNTLVYCGHEYTATNLRFALTMDPDNAALQQRALVITALVYQGMPTIPCLLGEEKTSNPFLRADDPAFAAALGLSGQPASAVFAHLRSQKDSFS